MILRKFVLSMLRVEQREKTNNTLTSEDILLSRFPISKRFLQECEHRETVSIA